MQKAWSGHFPRRTLDEVRKHVKSQRECTCLQEQKKAAAAAAAMTPKACLHHAMGLLTCLVYVKTCVKFSCRVE